MDSKPVKKARTGVSPNRKISMRTDSVNATVPPLNEAASPLFFSHTLARRVVKPASIPMSDMAAAMIASIQEETNGSITTVKLPQGKVSSQSPGVSGSTSGSLQSSGELSMTAPSFSPDVRGMRLGLQILQEVGVLELLENDDRPTFLVDLSSSHNRSRPGLPIIYSNASLRATQGLLQLFTSEHDDKSESEKLATFKSWVMGSADLCDTPNPPAPSCQFEGIAWVATTLRRRYRFISGHTPCHSSRAATSLSRDNDTDVNESHSDEQFSSLAVDPVPQNHGTNPPNYYADGTLQQLDVVLGEPGSLEYEELRLHPDDFANQVLQSLPIKATYDWTRIPMNDDLPEYIQFLKSVDWGATPLGPLHEWNTHLRTMSNLVIGTPHPAAMYWGPDYIAFYNAAFVELVGIKHPQILGMKCQEAWQELWQSVESAFRLAMEQGQATMVQDEQLFPDRNGYVEEAFFSYAVIPLLGDDGEIIGIYNPAFENTRRKIGERRMLTLREVGERVATAASIKQFWPLVETGLEYNEYDVPFSIIYAIRDEMESEVSSLHSSSTLHSSRLVLEGSPGVPDGHIAAPSTSDLNTSDQGFVPYMRQSLSMGGVPVVLSKEDGTLPPHLIEGYEWRGFGDPCRTVVVFPVIPTTAGDAVAGFIVLGINPRRPYDDDYKLFIHLLSRQLATSLASVVLFEEEIRRGRQAAQLAALDRQELSKQLWQRTQEASELEYKFTRMAEFAPVGIFIADGQGHIDYCNDMWWQISHHSRIEEIGDEWMDSVRIEDRPRLEATWKRLLEDKITISVEFRFNCSQQYGPNEIDTWVLMSAFPEKHLDGSLTSIFGCITDISSQKWAEKVQNERREEAVELKRQQENFIDITSHEMRNPLSAILQCVDQIADGISAFTGHDNRREIDLLLEDCLDAANTINLCASHQKRIVDDILTLSKLDSNLVSVTPVDEQPIRVVSRTLKMFESELIAHDIELEFRVDEKSFERCNAKWARLDPSRMRQVLINLMTNAIKFTQGRKKRIIIVSMCATRDISEMTSKGVFYLDRNDSQLAQRFDIDNPEEWGRGKRINIHCSVEDSGPGLGQHELKLLFQRFQQVTPRTHVQYGGSGLGLFISRILTEMQGGQIGVASEEDLGSKFSFYIQCRECENPPAEHEHISPFKIKHRLQYSTAEKSMTTTVTETVTETATETATTTTTTTTLMSMMSTPLQQLDHSHLVQGQSDESYGRFLFDVLIVEDNIVNQRVLQRQLRNFGNNTFVANHGREALQTLQRSRFWIGQEAKGIDISVILMDLEMPVMDGMTCARRIRELERQGVIVKHIPIIAVTAYARPEQIENAKAAGIDDVISKPFRMPELMPKIEELVGKYRPELLAETSRRVKQICGANQPAL